MWISERTARFSRQRIRRRCTGLFLVLCASSSNSFSSLSTTAQLSRPSDANRLFVRDGTRTFASAGDNDDKEAQDTESSTDNPAGEKAEQPEMRTSTVRIDDGGSNLTDRFKYKVNALMGVFDPADVSADTERKNGNILNAFLTFPVDYSFHVIGRTAGNENLQKHFVQQVKEIIVQTSANEEITCEITPRGSKFTKVTVQVQVVSSDVISSIYDQLGALELSVMQF